MMKTLLLCLVSVSLVSMGFANPLPPVDGLYHSVTQGGVLLDGHFSESWVGGEGMANNTLNAQSWDGATLGTEWKIWCAYAATGAFLVSDTRDVSGTGEVTYRTDYAGGYFWFSKFGPWSVDNLTDFTGAVQSLVVTSTHEFVFNQRIGVRANVTLSGLFDQLYPGWGTSCMEYLISNTSIFNDTTTMLLPPEFPGLLDSGSCPSETPGLTEGAWGSVTQITMLITGCAVPVQQTSWGAIKAIYGHK